ncbi:hypothetical protein B4087_0060 [Bacillus cereus]|nr:hypothetical protein B4087_0060 [Bacillus cereus]
MRDKNELMISIFTIYYSYFKKIYNLHLQFKNFSENKVK